MGDHRPGEGHRGQVPSQLLTQHRHLDQAEPKTTLVIGALDGRPTLFCHGRPQRVIAMPTAVGHLSHSGRRTGIVEETRSRVAQRNLIL